MLLNLSNHPSNKWSDDQRVAAQQQFGELSDMPFPNIPPQYSTDQVRLLAEQYSIQIRRIAAEHTLTVHLMGELTFCFALIRLLQQQGIPCVAATSQRNTIENLDGSKTIVFRFVQFRTYENLS